MFLTTLETPDYNTQWSIEDCDNNYLEATKAVSTFEGYILYKIKNDLHKVSKTQWETFCDKHNIGQRVSDSKIKYFKAQWEMSTQTEVIEAEVISYEEAKEALSVETELSKIPYSSYEKLTGKTVDEKMGFYGDIKAHLGKEQPTRADINKYKKELKSDVPKEKSETYDFSKELILCAEKLTEDLETLKEASKILKGYGVLNDYYVLLVKIYKQKNQLEDKVKV